MDLTRNETIKRIRDALKRRSGKAWSVTAGRGTAWGWLNIDAPPARRVYDWDGNPTGRGPDSGYTSPAEREELGKLLGLASPTHMQGEGVPSGGDYWAEYIDRAEGRVPSVRGVQYWD